MPSNVVDAVIVRENPLGPVTRISGALLAGAPSTAMTSTALDTAYSTEASTGTFDLVMVTVCVSASGEYRVAPSRIAAAVMWYSPGLRPATTSVAASTREYLLGPESVTCPAALSGRPEIVSESVPVRGPFESPHDASTATAA